MRLFGLLVRAEEITMGSEMPNPVVIYHYLGEHHLSTQQRPSPLGFSQCSIAPIKMDFPTANAPMMTGTKTPRCRGFFPDNLR